MDTVFVGPFESEKAAQEYDIGADFDRHVMTETEMRANVAAFGECPFQSPFKWES
jgi:hypothetical protein